MNDNSSAGSQLGKLGRGVPKTLTDEERQRRRDRMREVRQAAVDRRVREAAARSHAEAVANAVDVPSPSPAPAVVAQGQRVVVSSGTRVVEQPRILVPRREIIVP